MPDWRTSTSGARIRVALWLCAEVGEGGIFTKAALREAFPNVEQIDRRMRDLRDEGWVIATYREDRSLSSDELRLVREGGHIWQRGYQARRAVTTSDKARRVVFARDNYMCAYCGIGAGETYPDDALRTAKLTLSRAARGDEEQQQLLTVCDRCRSGDRDGSSLDDIIREAEALDRGGREQFREWMKRGRRDPTPVDILWAKYRRLSAESRAALDNRLRGSEA